MSVLDAQLLTRVLAIQTEIAADLDLSQVMQRVAQGALELTEASGAVIEMVDGEEMVYRACAGTLRSHLGMRLHKPGSLSGMCVDQRTPLACVDSENDPRVNREACRKVGLRSMIVVPLTRGEETVGVLKVMSSRPSAFDDVDLQLLQLMGGFIAFALYNATAYERANRQSLHDALTGLPNRILFRDRLAYQLTQLRRAPGQVGLLYLDLDGFKPVNDTHGHAAGDQVLVAAAQRILGCVRDTDTVARLGGDEFAVLLTQLNDAGCAQVVARRIQASIEETPFPITGGQVVIGASIGLAATTDAQRSPDALIADADTAMYVVKARRKAAPDQARSSA